MAAKEVKDLKAVLGDWGLAFELLKVLVHAILKKGGTIESLRRIIKEPDLVQKITDLLVDKVTLAFSALVTYIQPSYAELQRLFNWVDGDYSEASFKPIDRCKDVSRETREVSFEYVHLDHNISTDEVLAEMDRQGLRPALYEEGLSFAAKYPDEQRKFPILILGSVGLNRDGDLCVADLYRDDSDRRLNLSRVGNNWHGFCRFLAVRKPA